MSSKNVVADFYEMLFTLPAMNKEVKINLRISQKNVLILSKLIEVGLGNRIGSEAEGLFAVVNDASVEEIKKICAELLSSAELTETYNKINALQKKS